jgi:hypothetical protein
MQLVFFEYLLDFCCLIAQQVPLPALHLPQLRALDVRCCGAFSSGLPSLPLLETLGYSAPLTSGWCVVAEQTVATAAAAPELGDKIVAVSDVAALDGSLALSASASGGQVTATEACNPESLAAAAEGSCHSEAVLNMLANDIATPTRGKTWKIYCRK